MNPLLNQKSSKTASFSLIPSPGFVAFYLGALPADIAACVETILITHTYSQDFSEHTQYFSIIINSVSLDYGKLLFLNNQWPNCQLAFFCSFLLLHVSNPIYF